MKRTPPKPLKISDNQIADIRSAVFSLVEQQLESGFYLLAVDFEKEAGYWYLRIYVEGREAPISLNDCERISRHLDPLVEELPELQGLSYSLEISSPGLFRPLKTAREFDFYAGKPVRIEPVTGKTAPRNKPLASEGTLKSFDEARGVAVIQLKGADQPVTIPLDEQTVIYLNPEVHFPEEDEPAETDV